MQGSQAQEALPFSFFLEIGSHVAQDALKLYIAKYVLEPSCLYPWEKVCTTTPGLNLGLQTN